MLNIINESVKNSLPDSGSFKHNPKLEEKVSYRGGFLPFWGNTILFDLDDDTKARLKAIQDTLYAAAPDCLAQPIDPNTFHMTLHDLTAQVGFPKPVDYEYLRTTAAARSLVDQWQGQKPLQMRCGWVFNMVNTSMVVSLTPRDDDSAARLDAMYREAQQIVKLPYDLCPHITLAYFRPGSVNSLQIRKLRELIASHGQIEFSLNMENLRVCRFTDMNHYSPIQEIPQFQYARYPLSDGDLRTAVKVNYGTGYIAYVDASGTGLAVTHIDADGTPPWLENWMIMDLQDLGNAWLEGADELIGVYPTREEAVAATDRYFEGG